MKNRNHWILPEGIEEALPETAAQMEALRRELLDLYASWGYELVIPPFIDHIESLLTGTGHDLDLQTFKLVDQMSGRTLGIRADMTPQIARIDAHQLKRNGPTRLCYIGTVLHTRPESIGDSRSPMQVGVELYGHTGVESEVEVLGLMLQTFATVGVVNVHLDLGNVDIFRGLAKQAELTAEVESQLFEMMQRKAVTEINAFLTSLELDETICLMLQKLAELNGDITVLKRAREILSAADNSVHQAIDYLEKTATLLQQRFGSLTLHFDLAELQGYHYKTGVVFAAFVPQFGQAIARGGRYDDIGKLFGRARAATGFSTDLNVLIRLSGKRFKTRKKIFAPAQKDKNLTAAIAILRAQGQVVIEQLAGQSADADAMGCSKSLVFIDNQWSVKG